MKLKEALIKSNYFRLVKIVHIFSAIAPRQLLLRYPTTVRPVHNALPYYLPSMAVPDDRRTP
jgi:hypothetical protein